MSLLAVLPGRAAGDADAPPDLLDYLAAVRRFEAAGGAPESAALLSPAALDHVRLRLGLLAAAASSPQMRWAVLMHLTAGVRESLGGRVLEAQPGPRLQAAFAEVLNEIEDRYVLGFSPTDPGAGWHALEVRLRAGHRGAEVRARRGYERR